VTAQAFVAMVARLRTPQEAGDSSEALASLISTARAISRDTVDAVDEDEATRL
jgi:hypothetical protein